MRADEAGAACDNRQPWGCLAAAGDEAALAGAIGAALAIPRPVPQARVARLFTRDLWLDRCEALYAQARG